MRGIQRYATILDEISVGPETGLSITRLCQATGLPKGTVHRLLEGMQEFGLVVQEEKRWRLGPRVVFWAGKYLEGPASLAPLRGYVGRLSRETQFFSYLTVLDGTDVVCVAVERPESKAHFFVQLGSRVPVLSTAAAKALLSCQPEEVMRPLVERAIEQEPERVRAGGPGARLERAAVDSYLDELAEARTLGYAKCMEELEPGVSALGVPVVNARGLSVASLSVVAPTAALMEEWDACVETLLRMAEEASTMLGREREATRR